MPGPSAVRREERNEVPGCRVASRRAHCVPAHRRRRLLVGSVGSTVHDACVEVDSDIDDGPQRNRRTRSRYNVGERIGLPNGWLVQIVKVRRPSANPRLPALPAGRQYVALDVAMSNQGTTTETVNAADLFWLGDSTGREDHVVAVPGDPDGLDGSYAPTDEPLRATRVRRSRPRAVADGDGRATDRHPEVHLHGRPAPRDAERLTS